MLATALAVAAARGEHPAASMTLLTAMLDFSDTGVLDIFVDEAHVQMREQSIGGKGGTAPGVMRGLEFANTFSFLRPERSGVELCRRQLPEGPHAAGVRPAVLEQRFDQPAGSDVRLVSAQHVPREQAARAGCADDLRRAGRPVAIDVPTFIYGSREDHIVPWETAYASVPLLTGPLKFVLGASGHIAGVINPPAKNKRSYWVLEGDDKDTAGRCERVVRARDRTAGQLVAGLDALARPVWRQEGEAARAAGSADFPVIEPAPGRYVLQRE